jgi:gliding motility-associated-like protein
MIERNETDLLGNMRFKWTFSGFEPASYSFTDNADGDYPNVYHTFENGGDYTVGLEVYHIATPANAAVYSEVITLDTQFGADLIDFDNVPNIFTPNGDGVNDFYEVTSSGTSKLSFKVFSRSGGVVYEKDANIIKWDGKNYYGQDLPDGIYYFILEDISETKQYNTAKGFFYIYR